MIGSWDKLGYIAFKMAATKSSEDADPEDARQVRLSWHEKRCEVLEKSTKGKCFRSSLQCLDNNEILLLLESILQRSKPRDADELYSSRSESSARTSAWIWILTFGRTLQSIFFIQ